jgi:DNA-binding transcriptional LysR family regulator
LITRKIGDVTAFLYATPGYLDELGNPSKPEQFSDADFIGFDRRDLVINAMSERGFKVTQKNFPVTTESHLVHWELVKQGVAIGIMPPEVGDVEPRVRRVLPNMEPFTAETWLVAHRELRTSRRIRMVFDFLAAELRDS